MRAHIFLTHPDVFLKLRVLDASKLLFVNCQNVENEKSQFLSTINIRLAATGGAKDSTGEFDRMESLLLRVLLISRLYLKFQTLLLTFSREWIIVCRSDLSESIRPLDHIGKSSKIPSGKPEHFHASRERSLTVEKRTAREPRSRTRTRRREGATRNERRVARAFALSLTRTGVPCAPFGISFVRKLFARRTAT